MFLVHPMTWSCLGCSASFAVKSVTVFRKFIWDEPVAEQGISLAAIPGSCNYYIMQVRYDAAHCGCKSVGSQYSCLAQRLDQHHGRRDHLSRPPVVICRELRHAKQRSRNVTAPVVNPEHNVARRLVCMSLISAFCFISSSAKSSLPHCSHDTVISPPAAPRHSF